jgi:hypothetical protein
MEGSQSDRRPTMGRIETTGGNRLPFAVEIRKAHTA